MSAAEDIEGVNRKSVRVLRVVCEHDRQLVEVLRVNRRDIVVCRVVMVRERVRETWREGDPEPTVTTETEGLRRGTHEYVAYLDDIEPGAWINAGTTSCCARRIDFAWLNEQLRANVRRVMLTNLD